MPLEETVKAELYLAVLWYLREAVQKKRSEIRVGGGREGRAAAHTAGFFTTTTFTAHSALGAEVSVKKKTKLSVSAATWNLQQNRSCNRN